MDKEWAQEVAKDAAAKTGKEAKEAVSQAGAKVQPTLDQGKSMVQDLASRVSETGRQGMDRASEFIERVAPQAKEVANNLYGQGSQSQEYIRQYVVQQPLTALLIAGGIGYLLGYLTHRP
jgi:ElaB/YqjD/DUF883 family membrane-anchored ribosome-binding protein